MKIKNNNNIFVIYLISICLLPIFHGGETVVELFPFICLYFVLTVICLINLKPEQKQKLILIKLPIILQLIWLIYMGLYLIKIPNSILGVLAPLTEQTSSWVRLIDVNELNTLTIAPGVTSIELLKSISYFTFFLLTYLLIDSKSRIIQAITTVFICSGCIALYSLLNHYTSGLYAINSPYLPWQYEWEKVAFGTFSYRNHYALYLVSTIPLGLALIAFEFNKLLKTKLNIKNVIVKSEYMKVIAYLLFTTIMIIALLKTLSRAGIGLFFIEIVFLVLILMFMNKSQYALKQVKVVLFTLLVGGILIAVSGIADDALSRTLNRGFDDSGRETVRNIAMKIIHDSPYIGTGPGTYPTIQHLYKLPELNNMAVWQRPMNDYLELTTSVGLIGIILFMLPTSLLLIKAFTLSKVKQRVITIYMSCLVTLLIYLLYAFVDFIFQLPINNYFFYFFISVALNCQLISTKSKQRRIINL